MLPSVRYIELPSYSGYSMTPGPTIFTKPGSPDLMLQSTYSPQVDAMKTQRADSIIRRSSSQKS